MDAASSLSEESLKLELDDLQKQLNKKLRFETSVRSIHSLLRDRYSSSSPCLRKQVCLLFTLGIELGIKFLPFVSFITNC